MVRMPYSPWHAKTLRAESQPVKGVFPCLTKAQADRKRNGARPPCSPFRILPMG